MNLKHGGRGSLRIAAVVALATLTVQPFAVVAAQADPPAAPAAVSFHIEDATPVKVRLETQLKSGEAKVGDLVPFTVANDVLDASGHVIIARGTPAIGRVLESSHRGLLGKPGKLEFSCDYVAMPDGSRITLRSRKETKYGQDNRAADVAAAVILTPLALLIKGNDVTAREGSTFEMYANRDIVPANGTASSALLPAIGGRCSFLMNDGTAVVGTLVKYDGTVYHVHTDAGDRDLKVTDVRNCSPVQ